MIDIYKCVNCNEKVDTQISKRIRCPYCGYRILNKTRANPKKVEAK